MGFLSFLSGGSKGGSKDGRQELTLSSAAVIEAKVITAFSRVRQDISLVSSWVKYLKHKDLLHEQRHTKAQRELGEHKALIEGLKAEAAEIKATIHSLRNELKKELEEAKQAGKAAESMSVNEPNKFVSELNPNLIRTESGLNPNRKRTYFENRVVSMLRSRRKDYVLKQILELAEKETHSTREIEEVVVGEKALCGRTAFYDYLRELKHKKMIKLHEKGQKRIISLAKEGFE